MNIFKSYELILAMRTLCVQYSRDVTAAPLGTLFTVILSRYLRENSMNDKLSRMHTASVAKTHLELGAGCGNLENTPPLTQRQKKVLNS
jgi:hypothetical protein